MQPNQTDTKTVQQTEGGGTVASSALLAEMTFKDALKKLNIEDYGERIFNSNSHGELMHLYDYIGMATRIKDDAKWFRPMFLVVVEWAEKNWSSPESCFQHMPRLLREMGEALSANDGTEATARE